MTDLRQALRDFVATSNSGKYPDEATLLSKFPELQGYDVQSLKDFVATSNSGKYATENELFLKFPEFNISAQQPSELKKKEDTTGLPSEDGSLVSSKSVKPEMAQFGYQPGKPLPKPIPSVQPDQPKYTEEVMFGPMGISGVKTTGEAPEFQGKSIPKVVGEIGKVLAKGVVKSPAGVLETVSIVAAAAQNLAAKTGIVDETSALDISVPIGAANVNFYQAAGEWKDLVNDFVPTDKDIESGFWGQTANALGEMIPVLLTGLISGGAKAIAKEAGKKGLSMQGVANYGKNVVSRIGTPQGVLTISQVAAPSYEQAKLEGATENEALGFAIQNAVMTFPLEMLPVNNLFKRLDNALVGNTGVEVLKRAVVGGGEEFITEGVQAVYENVTADAIYGTTRSFLDGVGESAAVGGTVGAIMNGVLTALLGRRARATSAKEIEEIDKSITDVEQKIAQVDSNNESLKETVKVLEETKPRVLSYGSANYNFIESPEGALEYADDALTEEQAQGIIGNLTNSYKKIDFQIEEVEPDDPYQPTTYKIIGKPKTIQQDAIQEQAAGQVPVQSGTGVSQKVAQGVPQAEPQVIAQEGQEEVTFKETDFDKTLYQDKKSTVLNNEEFDFNRLNTKGEENVFTIEKNGEEIGRATLDVDGNYLTNIRVDEDYRRQGLGTIMYDYIEQQSNIKLQPSPSKQSKAAEQLWVKREQAKIAKQETQAEPQGIAESGVQEEVTPSRTPTKSILDADVDLQGNEKEEHMVPLEFEERELKVGDIVDVEGEDIKSANYRGTNERGEAILDVVTRTGGRTFQNSFVRPLSKIQRPTVLSKGNPSSIEYALENELYQEDIAEGRMTANDAKRIIESANLTVPNEIVEQAKVEEQKTQPEVKTTTNLATELSDKYGVELELQDNKTDNSISVPKIVVPKDQRKTGVGTKVMEEVIEFADSSGKRLALTPSTSFGGTSVKRLTDFYKSLGFVENKGKNKDFTIRDSMYRNPVPVAQEAIAVSPAVSPAPVKEEVITDDQIVEYNPTEEVSDRNNEVLGKVLQSKKFVPQAGPQRTDLGDSVVFEYNNFDDDDTRTWFTFKKKKDGTITGVGVKVDRNKGDFRGTNLFRNYVASKRAEASAISPEPAPVAKAKAAPKPTVKKPKAETKRQEIISRPAFTPITLARQWLLSGGKLRSTQSEENKRRDVGVGKGVREETGMGGVEMRQLIRVIDNKKGVSPEVAAERIYENLSPELQASMDVQDIRDSIIEVLLSEDRKSWIDNQDRETSEGQESELDQYIYSQLTDEERADFDEYEQRENYYNYLSQNAKRLAKEYDAYIKSQTYQDYIEEVYERDREGQIDAQDKNDGRGQEQGTDAGATPVQGQAAKAPEVDTVINEETGTLESALDFLDGVDKTIAKTLKTRANDVLLGIPLTVIQGMVKGLKVLVQGGMKLRDAIKKIAADNNISQDKLKDLLDLGAIAQDFNDLMAKADKLIARQKARGIEEKKIVSNLDSMVRKADVYINANDAQRKIMEREARAKMGVEARKAASIGRVIGVLKDITNVTREEKLKIISRIRELGRDVAKDLASEIREMAKGGTITPNQAANIIAKFGKVNMLNEISVSNFVDYMAKVFADAEYTNQLSNAASKRKSLRSLSKNKDKAANLRSLASKFIEIDPSMVDDIYEYNRIARLIDESIKGSSIRGKDVRFASIVQEGTVIPYINKTLETQREKLYEERLKEVSDILGVDAEGLSYEDLLTLLSEPKTKGKDNEKVVRDAINKAFEIYSSIINSSIETGVDPISGEKVSYTDSQKKLISQFMNMDLGLLSPKQALEAVDGLLNFIQNNSTAKMKAILKGYTGVKNAAELVKKGVKSSPLRKYFSQGLGRFFGEQTTNLGLLFERLFKGFEAGGVVQDAMGLTDLINGKSKAQIESNRIINDYVNEFYKKKANGQAFNTELNNVERGMAAWMMRNIIGTEAEMKAEFQRRKDLILKVDKDGNRTGSIAELENGNDKEQAKAKVYQEVYDKILDGSKTIDEVMSKVDAVNLEAVKFWQDQWQNKYDELADVSLNVYNKVLEKDINYTPDKYGKLSTSSGAVEITENDMAFHVNNGTLYNKEAGVLMEATRPEVLPVDNTTGEVDRYIDLSFDSNNANSMYDALVDIKTAGPIRQVQSFLNSKSFKKIFPQAEDATILKGGGRSKRIGRIELFTRNFRNKNPYSEDEFSNAVRNLNRLANVGVSQALGGVFQPIKQVVPVGINTLINGGGLDVDAMTNPAKIKFMMDSGYAIGFRGVESQAQVESLNKLMDMAAKSKGEKAIKYIEEANKIWLKIFLVKPDVFIARASWMTYYEQSLQKQGIDTKGIDYNTHELNEKAANYAQRMVDRQQNVSDADLSGKLFAEKNPGKQIMMKVFMPFASFRMNQSARIGADIATLTSKVSTEEDRGIAARSLAGFTVEMATFRALSLGISLLTAGVVAKMMGADEEDEEKKKNSIIKGQATNIISDILSPIPFADPFVQAIAATTLQGAQDIAGVEEENALSIYSPQDKGYLEQIGLFGFAAQRVIQTGELIWLSSVGNYRDNFGKKKYISPEDQEALRLLIGPALLTNLGLAPSEMNSVVRASMSAAKKNSSTKEGGPAGKDYESEMIDRIEEDLLEGYENKSELKRYNPRLYEQNFGKGSEYYELTKEKREEQKKAREEEQKEKDAEYGYKGKAKGFGSRSKSSGGGFGAKKFGED
jgi:GNAT superfamily N-acetyltransferase